MKTNDINDWTLEEIFAGVGETFDSMNSQKFTKNEPLYPVMRNALRWLVWNYIEMRKNEENEILQEKESMSKLPSSGEDEGLGNRA